MTLFFVLDVQPKDQLVVLYDSFGMYHLARAAGELPDIGTEMHGAAHAFAGPRVLQATMTGREFRLDFEAVNCGQGEAFERMTGAHSAAGDESAPAWQRIVPYGPSSRPNSRV
jgi:hypothetical protein